MYIGFMLAHCLGGDPRVMVSTTAFHARVQGSFPGIGGLKETKMFLLHPLVKLSIAGSLRGREVACSTSDRQGSNFVSCVWRAVSSHPSHHPQEGLLAQSSLYVHISSLKPDSFHLANCLRRWTHIKPAYAERMGSRWECGVVGIMTLLSWLLYSHMTLTKGHDLIIILSLRLSLKPGSHSVISMIKTLSNPNLILTSASKTSREFAILGLYWMEMTWNW